MAAAGGHLGVVHALLTRQAGDPTDTAPCGRAVDEKADRSTGPQVLSRVG